MSNLKICGLNHNIIWENKNANFKIIEKKLQNETADLFLLPEMFSTGFSMNPKHIADRNNESLNWMRQFAKIKNTAICGSVSVEENAQFYNRMYFVFPNGSYEKYDKRHLFSYSGEDKIYTKGNERKVVEYKGFRFLLQICYDLRFPIFSRNQKDYDAALYVANWPEKRVFAWEQLLKARAIENQAYIFGLNRIGTDDYGLSYKESSHCLFADGTAIHQSNKDIITAEIDLNSLNIFREKFKFLDDRDEVIVLGIK